MNPKQIADLVKSNCETLKLHAQDEERKLREKPHLDSLDLLRIQGLVVFRDNLHNQKFTDAYNWLCDKNPKWSPFYRQNESDKAPHNPQGAEDAEDANSMKILTPAKALICTSNIGRIPRRHDRAMYFGNNRLLGVAYGRGVGNIGLLDTWVHCGESDKRHAGDL